MLYFHASSSIAWCLVWTACGTCFSDLGLPCLATAGLMPSDDGGKEIVHAFTACGGNPDKSGFVKCDRVVHVVKDIFKLHFDIK